MRCSASSSRRVRTASTLERLPDVRVAHDDRRIEHVQDVPEGAARGPVREVEHALSALRSAKRIDARQWRGRTVEDFERDRREDEPRGAIDIAMLGLPTMNGIAIDTEQLCDVRRRQRYRLADEAKALPIKREHRGKRNFGSWRSAHASTSVVARYVQPEIVRRNSRSQGLESVANQYMLRHEEAMTRAELLRGVLERGQLFAEDRRQLNRDSRLD